MLALGISWVFQIFWNVFVGARREIDKGNYLRDQSKSTSLGKGGERFTKWVTQSDKVEEVQPKEWCHSLEIFMCSFFCNIMFSSLYPMSYNNITVSSNKNTTNRKKCLYSELFWSAFFPHFLAFDWIRRDTWYLSLFSPNAEKCRKNADQNNSEYGHFLPIGSLYVWDSYITRSTEL